MAVMQVLGAEALRKVSSFNVQSTSNLAWSCAKLQHKCDQLLGAAASAATAAVANSDAQALSNALWSLAALEVWHQPLQASISAKSTEMSNESTTQEASGSLCLAREMPAEFAVPMLQLGLLDISAGLGRAAICSMGWFGGAGGVGVAFVPGTCFVFVALDLSAVWVVLAIPVGLVVLMTFVVLVDAALAMSAMPVLDMLVGLVVLTVLACWRILHGDGMGRAVFSLHCTGDVSDACAGYAGRVGFANGAGVLAHFAWCWYGPSDAFVALATLAMPVLDMLGYAGRVGGADGAGVLAHFAWCWYGPGDAFVALATLAMPVLDMLVGLVVLMVLATGDVSDACAGYAGRVGGADGACELAHFTWCWYVPSGVVVALATPAMPVLDMLVGTGDVSDACAGYAGRVGGANGAGVFSHFAWCWNGPSGVFVAPATSAMPMLDILVGLAVLIVLACWRILHGAVCAERCCRGTGDASDACSGHAGRVCGANGAGVLAHFAWCWYGSSGVFVALATSAMPVLDMLVGLVVLMVLAFLRILRSAGMCRAVFWWHWWHCTSDVSDACAGHAGRVGGANGAGVLAHFAWCWNGPSGVFVAPATSAMPVLDMLVGLVVLMVLVCLRILHGAGMGRAMLLWHCTGDVSDACVGYAGRVGGANGAGVLAHFAWYWNGPSGAFVALATSAMPVLDMLVGLAVLMVLACWRILHGAGMGRAVFSWHWRR
ncbi:unnamed protein product [Polarella glacialis]|uniref:Uncharacterized protein n=1 Tax=Polarella glacialis TaxID=89957 RepID=A0A813E4U1_POLGL|nr:unnamed protein product [Polarella glacialis]